MEEIDDEDSVPCNVAPLNPSHLIEPSDGSDDEDGAVPDVIVLDDESNEESEEDAEAELGQS
jgi:hypothetical protein